MKLRNYARSTLWVLFTLGILSFSTIASSQVLRVWGGHSDPQIHDMWEQLKAAFEAEHPGVTVEYMIPTGNIDDGGVQAAIRSGAGPDVLLTNAGIGRVGLVAQAGLIEPLTELYEERGWNERLADWLYDDLRQQYNGALYEIPDGLDAIGLWYHSEILEQHGWELPTTYDEFLALGDQIREEGLFTLIVGPRSDFNGGHLFGNIIQAVAGREVMEDIIYGDGAWNQPVMVEAAAALRELVEGGYIPEEAVALDFSEASRLWFNKRAVFIVAGPWLVNNARTAGVSMDDFGYIAMPSANPEVQAMPTGGIGWSWMLPSNARERELAIEWLDFISEEETMLMRANHETSWMVYPKELPPFEPSVAALSDVYAAAEDGVGFNPSVYIPGNVLEAYYQAIQGIIGGIISPQAAMDLIQAEWERSGN